ncbi:type ii inositol-trisphosphate 5-phosphatase, partial [Nannochloropsis oceanica]
GRRRRARH